MVPPTYRADDGSVKVLLLPISAVDRGRPRSSGEPTVTDQSLDERAINTIRFLSVDAVQKANSGHPGLPMGAAAPAYVLWTRYLRHNPSDPAWPDRDRFVLSAGHGSMLLYSLLHLTGYDLPLEQIKLFRQFGSLTPGHPESHLTKGVEATTGPLGQGMGNAVGMAIAEAHLAARFNRPGHEIINHHTYVLASDGDMMEGVQSEAASLAGHLKLGKLIVLYDDNNVSLAGSTSVSFNEDVRARYAAYGWHVQAVDNGNDLGTVDKAIQDAGEIADRPSLIAIRTVIGYGAPHKQGTFHVHGSPLGPDEVKAAKENLGWPLEPAFLIPDDVGAHFRAAVERGTRQQAEWSRRFAVYQAAFPDLAAELTRRLSGTLPAGWDAALPMFAADAKGLATRKASEGVMQSLAAKLPELVGGSGDLDPSTFTWLKEQGDFAPPSQPQEGVQGAVGGAWDYSGRNVHFGVREHAMGAVVNGMAYHGGFIPYGSTFLVFSDYMRPAVRLSAIARLGSVWVYTHDSVGVGEDGPTHQPVEHFLALRAIPDLLFIRPCDANETVWAWKIAIRNRHRPTAMALTRQNVPTLDRSAYASAEGLARGAYVLNPRAAVVPPDVILIATGSEVQLIVAAEPLLARKGIAARLVSMPCWELFEEQSAEYRESVLPKAMTARLAVEMGSSLGWERWTGSDGATVTLDHFGASAPGEVLIKEFGFTTEKIVTAAEALLARLGRSRR
jgi:transketolase